MPKKVTTESAVAAASVETATTYVSADPEADWNRFEDAMRRLVRVPKEYNSTNARSESVKRPEVK